MNWEQQVKQFCKNQGLEVQGIEQWLVFVKDKNGKIFPIRESIVAEWINKLKNGVDINEYE